MTDENTTQQANELPPPGALTHNATHRVKFMALIPVPCGCEYEVSGEGDLPVTVIDGRILIDPFTLQDFLQQAATWLTRTYGEILMTPGKVHEAEPSPMLPRDIVAPSTDTPQ